MSSPNNGEPTYAEMAAELADLRHTREIDEKLIDRLYADGEVDRELIAALRAQGAADRESIADLEQQAAQDSADMANLRARMTDDAQEIGALQTQGALDRQAILTLAERGVVDRDKIANLEKALVSARQIGAAIGILMATRKVTQDAAVDLLIRASQRSHVKVRDIADHVLFTGLMPE